MQNWNRHKQSDYKQSGILMIYILFTSKSYYNLAVVKDRDSIFTTVTTIWKPGSPFLDLEEDY
jgi:hypothetical protein